LVRLDKDLNTLSMRIKEWYSWHFPELARLVPDNLVYVRLVTLIGVMIIQLARTKPL
jgi:RNA processing factor Prp31